MAWCEEASGVESAAQLTDRLGRDALTADEQTAAPRSGSPSSRRDGQHPCGGAPERAPRARARADNLTAGAVELLAEQIEQDLVAAVPAVTQVFLNPTRVPPTSPAAPVTRGGDGVEAGRPR